MLKRLSTAKLTEALKSLIVRGEEPLTENTSGLTKGEGLVKLHEYQHKVIVGLFRINLAGLFSFLLVVVSFTLFTFTDPGAPRWLGLMMVSVAALLMVGFVRTIKEFRRYHISYKELMGQLQTKLRQYFGKGSGSATGKKKSESSLLSALKPQEHKGWDAKPCIKCQKNIELLSAVCQHCGEEQEDMMQN